MIAPVTASPKEPKNYRTKDENRIIVACNEPFVEVNMPACLFSFFGVSLCLQLVRNVLKIYFNSEIADNCYSFHAIECTIMDLSISDWNIRII